MSQMSLKNDSIGNTTAAIAISNHAPASRVFVSSG